MRDSREYTEAMALVAAGVNDCEVSRRTGIPRRTTLEWRHRRVRSGAPRRLPESACPICHHGAHDFEALLSTRYLYLLGMYLGDGHITTWGRTYRLRVFLDMKWPDILSETEGAMSSVLPENRVSICRPDPRSGCAVLSVYSNQIVRLFPQHGPGPKHIRPIVVANWQTELVSRSPEEFLRGLIHSDGCRFTNRVHVAGKEYQYPRYNFTSAVDDIRGLFTWACDLAGVQWRRMNARNVSSARRESVARMDEFVGPKG